MTDAFETKSEVSGDAAGVTRDRIVAIARSWIGTPYHHQASAKGHGTDCLGLVRGVWRELYGQEAQPVPPYSRDWAEASGLETLHDAARRHLVVCPKESAKAGDVILFRLRPRAPAKHVGLLLDAGSLLHAMEGVPVSVIKITPWWWRHAVAAFRFPGIED